LIGSLALPVVKEGYFWTNLLPELLVLPIIGLLI
jgi:hypothetical protein